MTCNYACFWKGTTLGAMPRRLTLGDYLERRCSELGLTLTDAADQIGCHRNALTRWIDGTATPSRRNHARIEKWLSWEPGSVAAVLDARSPTPLRQATITQLRPAATFTPPRDPALSELVTEWQAMGLSEQTVTALTALYQSEKNRDDTERVQRYRNAAREAGG